MSLLPIFGSGISERRRPIQEIEVVYKTLVQFGGLHLVWNGSGQMGGEASGVHKVEGQTAPDHEAQGGAGWSIVVDTN